MQGGSTKTGMFPFYHSIQVDHRALYVDFDAAILFGAHQLTVASAKNRSFFSNKPAECTNP